MDDDASYDSSINANMVFEKYEKIFVKKQVKLNVTYRYANFAFTLQVNAFIFSLI